MAHGADAMRAVGAGGSVRNTRSASSRNEYYALFPSLPAWAGVGGGEEDARAALDALRLAMAEVKDVSAADDNPDIDAGYTYFGQFVIHDITYSSREKAAGWAGNEIVAINVHSPVPDLGSLYGDGPDVSANLYQRSDDPRDDVRYLLKVGRTRRALMRENGHLPHRCPLDLPRVSEDDGLDIRQEPENGTRPICADPLIADRRNDDHAIISQFHLLFARYHNALARDAKGRGATNEEAFVAARGRCTRDYRHVLVNDYLRRLLDEDVFAALFERSDTALGAELRDVCSSPGIPLEFMAAAGRMGHAMVRGVYDMNDYLPRELSTMRHVLAFSSVGDAKQMPMPADWVLDWRRFFDIDPVVAPQKSRRIGPFIASDLVNRVPAYKRDALGFLDLWRCAEHYLPSGQRIAKALARRLGTLIEIDVIEGEAMRAGAILHHDQHLAADAIDDVLDRFPALMWDTPLYYYVLQEGAVIREGRRLGPVGSVLFASAFGSLFAGGPGRGPGTEEGRSIREIIEIAMGENIQS